MDVTKAQHPDSMVLASVKIELSNADIAIDKANKTYELTELSDLGLARGVKIAFSSSKIDVKADNGTVPLKGQTDMKASVEFSLLERYVPLIGQIMKGIATVKIIGGTKGKKIDELHAASAMKDKLYEFKHPNYDGAKPENIVIKQGTKTLTSPTDYTIEKGAAGAWGYLFTTAGAFDSTKATTVEYEITPIKAYSLGKGSGGVVQPISMRLTNKRKSQDGRIISRTFDFPYGFYDGEDSIAFKSKNDADTVAEVAMKFEFSPHPDLVLDEDFEPFSLYRETPEV